MMLGRVLEAYQQWEAGVAAADRSPMEVSFRGNSPKGRKH